MIILLEVKYDLALNFNYQNKFKIKCWIFKYILILYQVLPECDFSSIL